MSVERYRSPVAITTIPRNKLALVHHKEIDAILKDLRLYSRRLKSVLECFEDELRTLERLYYKCKNQHRMALFFKRVPEMRRYGRRLIEFDTLERVGLLRASFVGLEHTNDRKTLRSSWSHVPETPHVYFLMERLTACSTLVRKMRERLGKAYHHFVLAMQAGAFVQLIILFVAISSRMSVLSSELEDALQLSISTCGRLLVIVHPTGTHPTKPPPELETLHPLYTKYDALSEDTGQPLSPCEPINSSVSVVEDLSMKTKAMPGTQVTLTSNHSVNAVEYKTASESKPVVVRVAQRSQIKKTRKKFDEIDEIFGF